MPKTYCVQAIILNKLNYWSDGPGIIWEFSSRSIIKLNLFFFNWDPNSFLLSFTTHKSWSENSPFDFTIWILCTKHYFYSLTTNYSSFQNLTLVNLILVIKYLSRHFKWLVMQNMSTANALSCWITCLLDFSLIHFICFPSTIVDLPKCFIPNLQTGVHLSFCFSQQTFWRIIMIG